MKTPKEIMKIVTGYNDFVSIKFGESRTIKEHLDKPCVAYGIGYNCAIIVIKLRDNRLKAYSFAAKYPFSKYNYAGFSEIDVKRALDAIMNNKYVVDKEIDMETIEKAKNSYERPVVAEFAIKNIWKNYKGEEADWVTKYRITRFKNGRLRPESQPSYTDKFHKTEAEYLISKFEEFKKGENDESEILISSNFPDGIMAELKGQIMLNRL
ncbi:hypothetical protein KY320_01555 [Candidatus Woesearchaeota archaeon]|nr:hypothetical protein [Candidatus Woesearchaeota archaeon]